MTPATTNAAHMNTPEPTDTDRIVHLHELIKACPHTRITFDDSDDKMPWFMDSSGCEEIAFEGESLRDIIDQSISYSKSGEDFDVWHADYHGDPRNPSFGVAR